MLNLEKYRVFGFPFHYEIGTYHASFKYQKNTPEWRQNHRNKGGMMISSYTDNEFKETNGQYIYIETFNKFK